MPDAVEYPRAPPEFRVAADTHRAVRQRRGLLTHESDAHVGQLVAIEEPRQSEGRGELVVGQPTSKELDDVLAEVARPVLPVLTVDSSPVESSRSTEFPRVSPDVCHECVVRLVERLAADIVAFAAHDLAEFHGIAVRA